MNGRLNIYTNITKAQINGRLKIYTNITKVQKFNQNIDIKNNLRFKWIDRLNRFILQKIWQ